MIVKEKKLDEKELRELIKNKKICPSCSSIDVVNIIYGQPDAKDLLSIRKGESLFGDSFVDSNSCTKYCKTCGKNFNRFDKRNFNKIKNLKLIIEDSQNKSFGCLIDFIEEGALVKVVNKIKYDEQLSESIFNNENKKEFNLERDVSQKLMKELDDVELIHWNNRYESLENDLNLKWKLELELENNQKVQKQGENNYPAYWSEFLKIINNIN